MKRSTALRTHALCLTTGNSGRTGGPKDQCFWCWLNCTGRSAALAATMAVAPNAARAARSPRTKLLSALDMVRFTFPVVLPQELEALAELTAKNAKIAEKRPDSGLFVLSAFFAVNFATVS